MAERVEAGRVYWNAKTKAYRVKVVELLPGDLAEVAFEREGFRRTGRHPRVVPCAWLRMPHMALVGGEGEDA